MNNDISINVFFERPWDFYKLFFVFISEPRAIVIVVRVLIVRNLESEEDRSLLVVMSFAEWLQFLQKKTTIELEEEADKRALRAQWQKLKMAEAIEEENEEIPENVFEMAVNSISREEGSVVSESMAVVYAKQGKRDDAIAIYKKLSLKNPEKSTYFADKINNLKKEI